MPSFHSAAPQVLSPLVATVVTICILLPGTPSLENYDAGGIGDNLRRHDDLHCRSLLEHKSSDHSVLLSAPSRAPPSEGPLRAASPRLSAEAGDRRSRRPADAESLPDARSSPLLSGVRRRVLILTRTSLPARR